MELNEHNVIVLLKPFTKDELHSLKKFIASPYFNTNLNISKIFSEIIKFHPKFENKNFTKEFIYKRVFPGKNYSDANMRWMLSEIHHLLEKYFAQKHFDKDILMKDNYLSTEYFNGMKKELIRKYLDNAKENLNNTVEKDYIYYFHKYIYLTNELNYLTLFKQDKKAKDLDFYFNTYLKALISYTNHSIVGITYDYLNSEILLSRYLKNGISKKTNTLMRLLNFQKVSEFMESDNEDASEIKILTKILNMFLYPENEQLYKEMRLFLIEKKDELSFGDKANYYSKLISYCRLKIINGINQDYYKSELYEITRIFFKEKYYSEGRVSLLSPVLFRLTLLNIIELGKYEFAEKFIADYSHELPITHRENAVNYGKALLCFYRKDFENALSFSCKVEGNFFLTDQKMLRIILFIEKGFTEECKIEIKSFKKFLQTNKFLSHITKQSLEKFLEFIKYISSSPNKKNIIQKKNLNRMIQDAGITLFKDWLIEKINGL